MEGGVGCCCCSLSWLIIDRCERTSCVSCVPGTNSNKPTHNSTLRELIEGLWLDRSIRFDGNMRLIMFEFAHFNRISPEIREHRPAAHDDFIIFGRRKCSASMVQMQTKGDYTKRDVSMLAVFLEDDS